MIPVFVASAILGPYLPCAAVGNTVGEWGDRCARACSWGPPVLLLQWAWRRTPVAPGETRTTPTGGRSPTRTASAATLHRRDRFINAPDERQHPVQMLM